MAITGSDLEYRLSTTVGSAGNTTAQADPNASLGKYMSTTAVSGVALNSLFDDISGDENVDGDTEYRCGFILNNHATLTWTSVVIWLSAETSGGADIAIAVDNVGPVAKGSALAQADQIADEDTAPTAVGAFSSPTTKATGLALGDIAPGECAAFWVRRTISNVAALDADDVTLSISGDTAA